MSERSALKYFAVMIIVPVTCLIFMTFYTLVLVQRATISCIEQGFEWTNNSCRAPVPVLED